MARICLPGVGSPRVPLAGLPKEAYAVCDPVLGDEGKTIHSSGANICLSTEGDLTHFHLMPFSCDTKTWKLLVLTLFRTPQGYFIQTKHVALMGSILSLLTPRSVD